jgi:putative DNA primase/helicase
MTSAAHLLDDETADQIATQMEDEGIEPPAAFIADGRLHRFGYKDASWYVVHLDPIAPRWSFGDWRLDIKKSGKGDPGRTLTPEEVRERKRQIAEQAARAAAQKTKQEANAALEAEARWLHAKPAPSGHPYLVAKGIGPCGVRIEGRNLLVPFYDIDGKLWSLQGIAPDGTKDNQFGGRRRSCFFPIGAADEPNKLKIDGNVIVVGEGFSTCASLHAACGGLVVSAGTAGELERAARAMRVTHPTAIIVIAAVLRSAVDGIVGRGFDAAINHPLKPHWSVVPSRAVVPRRSRATAAMGQRTKPLAR